MSQSEAEAANNAAAEAPKENQNQNILAIWICFYKQKVRRAIKSNNVNLLYSILYQHNVEGQCPFKRLARSACGLDVEELDTYTDKFYRHRLHHGVSCDCTDCDLDNLCLEHNQFQTYLKETNMEIHDAMAKGLPVERWAPTYTASVVLESRGISATNTPFMANAIENKIPQFNDKVENWWEMDEKFLFPQPTQNHTPIDFLCPCLLQCTCPMELSVFSTRSAYDEMPVPAFAPLVCPLILALSSRNQEMISLFLGRLFTKIQPNILPPVQKNDKEGNPLPPEPRNVKEPRSLQPYDKEYMAGKMLTLLTQPCRGYASILVYNYPTTQWKQQLRERLKIEEEVKDDGDNFMALLFNYYDMGTSLLLRNKRLSLLSPAQFLNFCGLEVARKLLTTKINLFGNKIDILDSANRRLDLMSTKKYVDLSEYENKIKLATRQAICYGPAPEGQVQNPPEESSDEEDEDEDFDPSTYDPEKEPPAIPFRPVVTIDENQEHLIDPDVLDTSGPPLTTQYWRDMAKTVPPALQPFYQVFQYLVADDWTKLAELWEESTKEIQDIHLIILTLLKKGEDFLFAYSSMAKCNSYQIQKMEDMKTEHPEFWDLDAVNEDMIQFFGSHIMCHLRSVVIGLSTGSLTTETQDEKLPLEAVVEVLFSPLYIGDVIFSSTTTMYWKKEIHMSPDYDLSLSQELTAFTGLNIRGLTYAENEYVLLSLRHDNVRFFCSLVYLIIEINGLPARFVSKYGQNDPQLAQDPRRAMAMVCEFVPDLRALLSSTSLLIIALKGQAIQCVMALTQMFPIWCWQQLATWAYTGFSPSEAMRLARTMSESIPPVLASFDHNTIRKLTPIFGRYMHALVENHFDPELLDGDGEATGIVYGVYDKYIQSRKGYFTRGDGQNGISTEYNEADIHSHRSMVRDLRYYMETQEIKCPFCLAGHCDSGYDHGMELDSDTIYRMPTGLIDIAIIMGHTSVASSLLLLSMALRTQFSLTETFRLFSKEVIVSEDESLFETKEFGTLTPENSSCICQAKSIDELHHLLPKRFYPYLMVRFLCSPLLIPSYQEILRNSSLYVHPFVIATALDNQDIMHLFNTAGFDTLTSTEVHNYAVDPLTASVGSPTTIMLRTMFTLVRQRFKRLIMILFNCARSVTSSVLCTDELVFTSAIAHPLPIITHAYVKFPYEMFQVRPQENAKTMPLSSRLLMFSHSNVVDFMLYDLVSTAANGIMKSYGVADKYLLQNDFHITPASRREEEPYPGDEETEGAAEGEEDDEEENTRRREWYAEQKRLRDEEDEELQPDPQRRETPTPSFAMALRTASPWVLYSLLRCVHPAYDVHEALRHVNEHIITHPDVTIYSNTPFVYNDNAGIGSTECSPNPAIDDAITPRNRDLLQAVAAINKFTAAVQLNAKATGDRLGQQWSFLYNQFPVGLRLDPALINDEVPFAEVHPGLPDDEKDDEFPHFNKEAVQEVVEADLKREEEMAGGDNFGLDELKSELTPEQEAIRQLEQREKLLARLKFDRFESREKMPARRSPYCTDPTNELDLNKITDSDGTPLSDFLQRGMLSTMPSRKYNNLKSSDGSTIPVHSVLLSAMLHCLNGKVYGVPTGKENQIMTVPMIALAQRCNNVEAFCNIVARQDKTLFDVFVGYASVISPDEQPEQAATMPGHEPQALRDAMDQIIQDNPEWGAHIHQSIDHCTEVITSSIQGAFKTLQKEMNGGADDDDDDNAFDDIF